MKEGMYRDISFIIHSYFIENTFTPIHEFQAANPGCVLGDFVRWYSPRDWIDEETVDEHGNVAKKGEHSIVNSPFCLSHAS